MTTCSNCHALELRIRRLEADDEAHLERIADLQRKLARSQALSRKLGRHVATLGGVLTGRTDIDALAGVV